MTYACARVQALQRLSANGSCSNLQPGSSAQAGAVAGGSAAAGGSAPAVPSDAPAAPLSPNEGVALEQSAAGAAATAPGGQAAGGQPPPGPQPPAAQGKLPRVRIGKRRSFDSMNDIEGMSPPSIRQRSEAWQVRQGSLWHPIVSMSGRRRFDMAMCLGVQTFLGQPQQVQKQRRIARFPRSAGIICVDK